MYLTLTLNPSIDHFLTLPPEVAFKPQDKSPALYRGLAESFLTGGKGINVATVLRRLTDACGEKAVSKVGATGFTAGFTGKKIIEDIKARGISPFFIDIPGVSRINLKITDAEGRETEINGPGPSVSVSYVHELISHIKDIDFDTLFISGSLPPSLPSDTYALIVNGLLKSRPDIRVAADTSGDALKEIISSSPFLIKPNAAELSQLIGRPLDDNSPSSLVFDALSEARLMGARNILLSMGANGARLLAEDGNYYEVSGIPGEVKSTIGAGDTMTAAFIFMLDKSRDIYKALSFANSCAALASFTEGLPSEDSFRRII